MLSTTTKTHNEENSYERRLRLKKFSECSDTETMTVINR